MSRVYDVIVIGATVAGLTSAVVMARRGVRVAVLDPNPPASSAAVGHGLVTLATGDLAQLKAESEESFVQRLSALRQAMIFITVLADEADVPRRRLTMAERALHRLDELDDERRLLNLHGIVSTASTDQPLPGLCLSGGWSLPDQLIVDPKAYATALNSLAAASGVTLLHGVTVTRFRSHQMMQAVYYRSQLAWEQDVRTLLAPRIIDTQAVSPWGLQARTAEILLAPLVFATGLDLQGALAMRDTPARLIMPWQDRTLIVGHPVPAAAVQTAKVGLQYWAEEKLNIEVTGTSAYGIEPSGTDPIEGGADIHGSLWAGGNGLWELGCGTAAGLKLADRLIGGADSTQRLPIASRVRAFVSRRLG